MYYFNKITTAIFDPLMGTFGPWQETVDLWVWPILAGVSGTPSRPGSCAA